MYVHKFTQAEIRFLKRNAPGRKFSELAALFNKHFGFRLKHSKIIRFCSNNGIRNGRDCRFRKGQEVWNKGLKGYSTPGFEKAQFKKGNKPHNFKPVGTERITRDGYLEIKIADRRKWRGKHIIVWEKVHGAVPKGNVIIFADGDRTNCNLKNLLMISRKELAVMNKCGLIYNNADFTETGKLIADLKMKISERKRDIKKAKKSRRKGGGK